MIQHVKEGARLSGSTVSVSKHVSSWNHDESCDEEDVGDKLLPRVGAVELEHLKKKVMIHDKATKRDEAAPPTDSWGVTTLGST